MIKIYFSSWVAVHYIGWISGLLELLVGLLELQKLDNKKISSISLVILFYLSKINLTIRGRMAVSNNIIRVNKGLPSLRKDYLYVSW